jgi:hypothetical protein
MQKLARDRYRTFVKKVVAADSSGLEMDPLNEEEVRGDRGKDKRCCRAWLTHLYKTDNRTTEHETSYSSAEYQVSSLDSTLGISRAEVPRLQDEASFRLK